MRVTPPAHSIEAAAYAGLQVPVLAGPAAGRRPRGLSEKQRAGFLGTAAVRIVEEARERGRRWLRRLDVIHASGCRTKQQRWDSLAALAEPLLARLDLATLALGWLDSNGAFRLNRQRGLAEDSGLSEVRVSRLLSSMEAAQYARRKVRRIFHNGQRWITRVTIHLRPRFFIDLGLGHQLAEARSRKKAQRQSHLRDVQARQQRESLDELAAAQQRRQSILNRETRQKVKVARIEEERALDRQRLINEAFYQLQADNPDWSPGQIRAELERRFPPA